MLNLFHESNMKSSYTQLRPPKEVDIEIGDEKIVNSSALSIRGTIIDGFYK